MLLLLYLNPKVYNANSALKVSRIHFQEAKVLHIICAALRFRLNILE